MIWEEVGGVEQEIRRAARRGAHSQAFLQILNWRVNVPEND